MRTLPLGKAHLELGGPYLGWLRESDDLRGGPAALRARLEEDGYLLVRGLHDPAKVTAARRHVLECLQANGQIDESYPLDAAVVPEGGRGAFLGGQKSVTRSRPFLDLVESPEVMSFFAGLFSTEVRTYDYEWLRVVGPGGFTGAHYDIVYMGHSMQGMGGLDA